MKNTSVNGNKQLIRTKNDPKWVQRLGGMLAGSEETNSSYKDGFKVIKASFLSLSNGELLRYLRPVLCLWCLHDLTRYPK